MSINTIDMKDYRIGHADHYSGTTSYGHCSLELETYYKSTVN